MSGITIGRETNLDSQPCYWCLSSPMPYPEGIDNIVGVNQREESSDHRDTGNTGPLNPDTRDPSP
jgi:hypothetical protein